MFNNAINSDLDFRPRLGFTIVSVLATSVVADVATDVVADVVAGVVAGVAARLATSVATDVVTGLVTSVSVVLIAASVVAIVTVLSFLERRGFLSFSSVFLESIIEDFLDIFTYTLNVSFNLNHFNIIFLLDSFFRSNFYKPVYSYLTPPLSALFPL